RTPGSASRLACGMGPPHSSQWVRLGPAGNWLRALSTASWMLSSICSWTARSCAQPVAMAFSSGVVHEFVVLVCQPVGVEAGLYIAHALFHQLQPASRLIVVHGQGPVLEQLHQLQSVFGALGLDIPARIGRRYQQTVVPVHGELRYPAVADGQVDRTVHGGSHATGARGLAQPLRR